MRAVLTRFVQELRGAGLRISVAETLDAMAAVQETGIEPQVLREALAATLVKEEDDRARFDEVFDATFAAPPASAGGPRGRKPRGGAGGESQDGTRAGRAAAQGGAGTPASGPPSTAPPAAIERPDRREREEDERAARGVGRAGREPTKPQTRANPAPAAKPRRERGTSDDHRPQKRPEHEAAAHRASEAKPAPGSGASPERTPEARLRRGGTQQRALRDLAQLELSRLDGDDAELALAAARELGRQFAARVSRRERAQRRGRTDIRRTIRASLSHGGTPIEIRARGRRPGRPRLIALCDVSGSVARASEMLLAILDAAGSAFAGGRRFAYVDHLVPITFEDGRIVPEGMLDMHARSDLGQVLGELEHHFAERIDRGTVLLILGDARNNRRPARADALRRLALRARAVILALPEPRARWNTGDSALAAYAPACDRIFEATTLAGLVRALRAARAR